MNFIFEIFWNIVVESLFFFVGSFIRWLLWDQWKGRTYSDVLDAESTAGQSLLGFIMVVGIVVAVLMILYKFGVIFNQ